MSPQALLRGARRLEPRELVRPIRSLHVLLAEDDPDLRDILAVTLREDGHAVTEVCDGERLADAIVAAACDVGRPIDLVITDVRMPGRTGLRVLDDHHLVPGCPPFVVMTGFGDEEVRAQAERLGALGVLDKPFSPEALRVLVDRHARALS